MGWFGKKKKSKAQANVQAAQQGKKLSAAQVEDIVRENRQLGQPQNSINSGSSGGMDLASDKYKLYSKIWINS